MGSLTHDTNGNDEKFADLTQIRGIGVVRKRWLTAIGINTIAELAQASADELATRAKQEGRSLSHEEFADWIAQAQAYSAEAPSEPAASLDGQILPASGSDSDRHSEQVAEVSMERDDEAASKTWESFAAFRVDCQTRNVDGKAERRFVVHQLETDETESWDELDATLMQQWMRDRVEHQLADFPTTPPITAEITRLRVLQPHYMTIPMVADKTIPIFADALRNTAPFALEASLNFVGPVEAYSGQQMAYRVQCLARNLTTGVTDCLGESIAYAALENDSIYTILLPSLQLPEAGSYRLKVLVTVQQIPAVSGHFKVPLLQVV